jgi:hypothetical protein
MSELTATRVPVLPGADVRLARTGESARVVGPCLHGGTGQEGVAVEGPLPGQYTYHTLEAFARLFEPVEAPAPRKAADQTTKGKGY